VSAGLGPDRPGSGRRLGVACAGSAVAASLLWGGSVGVWYTVTPPGRPPVELTGSAVSAVPGAMALLALAAVAGVVATRGPLRRVLGVLLALAGGAAAAATVRGLLGDPFAADTPASGLPQLPAGVSVDALRGQPVDVSPVPLAAVAGAVVLLAVGLFVLLREPRLAHLGARHGSRQTPQAELDPDRAAWRELDGGGDPTVDPADRRPG
jgi:uncharacterized membrane protein (TIGR02234 family)